MSKYSNDPRRITAKFNSSCSRCSCRIKRGSTAYYWPGDKTIMCASCGEPEYRQFLSMAADEDVYNGVGNPY